MGKQSRLRRERREAKYAFGAHPLAFIAPYETATTVFGRRMAATELVDRISDYSWKEAFIRLAHVAALTANDELGPRSKRARRWLLDGLRGMTGSDTELIQGALKRIEARGVEMVISHEEALVLLQHLVLLYGNEDGPGPAATEVALWLLAAGDHLDGWAQPDSRPLTNAEQLIAEQTKVGRFNRSMDSARGIVRAFDIFRSPPKSGPLSSQSVWEALQRDAFGEDFESFFATKFLPLFLLSHHWGTREGDVVHDLPFVGLEVDAARDTEKPLTAWLRSEVRTRDELRDLTRTRMSSTAILPHGPTALLHHPLIFLDENKGIAASPWMVRAQLQVGLWARYLAASKRRLGDSKGGMEWTRAFGMMFESWMRNVALNSRVAATVGTVVLPSTPGAPDEIEDVVLLERGGASVFSGKSTMMRESVARHAHSRSEIIDWYEKFLFAPRTGKFSAGAIHLLSANIDRVRAGAHEPILPRGTRVFPVLVTFDFLCEDTLLYEWIVERCRALGLLQQPDVAPLTLAHVEDFETLFAYAATGGSVARLLHERQSRWAHRRIDVQLAAHSAMPRRAAWLSARYDEIVNTMSQKLWNKTIRPPAVNDT